MSVSYLGNMGWRGSDCLNHRTICKQSYEYQRTINWIYNANESARWTKERTSQPPATGKTFIWQWNILKTNHKCLYSVSQSFIQPDSQLVWVNHFHYFQFCHCFIRIRTELNVYEEWLDGCLTESYGYVQKWSIKTLYNIFVFIIWMFVDVYE